MNPLKSIFVFLVLASSFYAVNADFHNSVSSEGYHFGTDLQFKSDFTLSLVSGGVMGNANPKDLSTGDIVCSGSVLQVSPSFTSKWAVSKLNILSLYPECGNNYCPAMVSSGGLSKNKDIRWLSASVYNEHDDYGDSDGDYVYDISQPFTQNKFNDLKPFVNEPVTYRNLQGDFSNKEAGVNVYCKGNLLLKDAGKQIASSNLPNANDAKFTISGNGPHAISTSLSGVSCFGALVKHPLDDQTHKDFFRLYYFTQNQPNIGGGVGTDTITLNVQEAGGICAMHAISVSASSSDVNEGIVMVRTLMTNTGDPIMIISVSNSNPNKYGVMPFPTGSCNVLGFPAALCPSDNGFGEQINKGTSKPLYVIVQAAPGASGGTVLTFHAKTISQACGQTTCDADVDISGAVTCSIEPPSLTLGTKEVAQFKVSCEDLGGKSVPCVGSGWKLANLVGGFVDKDNTQAKVYVTSPPGSSGTLRYQSGIALCVSDLDIVTPTYKCDFIPPTANMNTTSSQFFELSCSKSGSQKDPDSASYSLINGLTGTTSGASKDGVTYNSPSKPTKGDLLGFGKFNDAPPPILGAIAIAPITVLNGSGNNGNGSNDSNNSNGSNGSNNGSCHGCGNHDGSTEFCTIGSGPINAFDGFTSWVGIMCGPNADKTCAPPVQWSVEIDQGSYSLSNSSEKGTYVTINGKPGTSGKIIAITDSGSGGGCSKDFTIGKPACWEQS